MVRIVYIYQEQLVWLRGLLTSPDSRERGERERERERERRETQRRERHTERERRDTQKRERRERERGERERQTEKREREREERERERERERLHWLTTMKYNIKGNYWFVNSAGSNWKLSAWFSVLHVNYSLSVHLLPVIGFDHNQSLEHYGI